MIKPKKSLGQHFLTDHNIARKIADSLEVSKLPVLEIGPGTGMLTQYLLKAGHPRFHVIEIDSEAARQLIEMNVIPENQLILADFLKFDLDTLYQDRFNIIGNFPYNISSQIFFKVLSNRKQVDTVVCMIQKEVAIRIASGPGTKDYGILSVLLQAFYDIEYLFTVGENVFFPPPKVKSGVIRLKRNQVEFLDCDEALFFRVVKTAFNQRRKTLRNALKPLSNIDLQIPDVYTQQRAERLSVNDFVALTRHIEVQLSPE
jgi:16S rRNA (adenine1518-N6/adenine1519-N6)-dimethyltransferase